MGIPEGRVRSMGGSRMGKVMIDYFKISDSRSWSDRNILFYFQNILGLTKTSFFSNSLTERARPV
jgi:hypothetical protein